MIPKYITQELQSGTSLEDCLIKYNTNLKELFSGGCNKGIKSKRKFDKKRQYIQERYGKFYLRKSVKGKTKQFGTYNSLEDAVLVRDELMKHGWIQSNVDGICETLGVSRVNSKSKVRYS